MWYTPWEKLSTRRANRPLKSKTASEGTSEGRNVGQQASNLDDMVDSFEEIQIAELS